MVATVNSTGTSTGVVITPDSSGVLALQTAGTTAVTVDTSQNVGIGTTSPTDKLTVPASVRFGATSVIRTLYLGQSSPADNGSGSFEFQVSNTVKNWAIRTNYNVAGALEFCPSTAAGGTTYTTPFMIIDSSGNLCVNSTSAVLSGKLTTSFAGNAVNGATFNDTTSASGAGFCIFSIGGTAIGNISRVASTSAVAYNTTSDQRLKSNIADSQSVLDKLMAVKVRQFDWTGGDLHQDYGFIAQELEPTLSGIVSKGKTDEDMWQLDYAKLTPHLVKAIQELKALTDTQAETINALTARIVALEGK